MAPEHVEWKGCHPDQQGRQDLVSASIHLPERDNAHTSGEYMHITWSGGDADQKPDSLFTGNRAD